MAWEISISGNGWVDLRNSLLIMAKKWLFDAYNHQANIEGEKPLTSAAYKIISKEDFVDIICGIVERVNTTNNGGFVFWVTSDGLYSIHIDSYIAKFHHGTKWRNYIEDGKNYQ